MDPDATNKLELVSRLIGRVRQGKSMKWNYVKMLMTSEIKLDKDKMEMASEKHVPILAY